MIGFWIAATVLCLLAAALFLPALRGFRRTSPTDRQRLNWLLHQQRQVELAGELGGKPDPALLAELGKDLLNDLSASTDTPRHGANTGRASVIVGLLLALSLGVMVYLMLGRYDLADFQAAAETPAEAAVAPEIQDMINRLAEKLRQNPNDVKGWLLLGRSYQQTGQSDLAVDAYAQALKREPDNLDAKAWLAQSLAESQGGGYDGEPIRLVNEILAKNPKHHTALWLAGVAAAQAGNTVKAIGYLESLRGEFAKGSAEDENLGKIIAELKGEPAQAAGEAQAGLPATGEQLAIKVKVSLSPALTAQVKPGDAVFIFARAAVGPPMPLAVVRKSVKDLPVEVGLDDSMAMVQGMSLSSFDRLVIGARVSKSGQPIPQPGDLQGLSPPVSVNNGELYAVEISETIP